MNPRCENYTPTIIDALNQINNTLQRLLAVLAATPTNVNQVDTTAGHAKKDAEYSHVPKICLDCQCGDHCGGYNSVSMGSTPTTLMCGRCQCKECEGSK